MELDNVLSKMVWSYGVYFEQIGESAGPECKAVLQKTNKLLELRLKVNGKAVKALFNATEVSLFLSFSWLPLALFWNW